MAKTKYYKDTDNEFMFLEMLEDMDFDTAESIYQEVYNTKLDSYLSSQARELTFEEFTYRNLRYLIIGCQECGAEVRVKALATFIYRAQMPKRLSALVPNDKLMEVLHKSLSSSIATIYKWSGLEYP